MTAPETLSLIPPAPAAKFTPPLYQRLLIETLAEYRHTAKLRELLSSRLYSAAECAALEKNLRVWLVPKKTKHPPEVFPEG